MPFYSRSQKKKALENIKLLGIENLKNSCFRELSGAQKQRVMLARALCATKKILVLDEPVTGLDPIVSSEFHKIVKEINKVKNIAILMVTHDIKNIV